MPFNFQCLAATSVAPPLYKGTLLDISYNGLRVEVPSSLNVFSEIKFSLNFFAINEQYSDIYAKVLRCWEGENKVFQCSLEFSSLSVDAAKGIKKFIHRLVQADLL